MECLIYKGGYGICEHTRIEMFEEELGWAIDKRLRLIIINNQVLRKIKIAVENDVKNWAYISLR